MSTKPIEQDPRYRELLEKLAQLDPSFDPQLQPSRFLQNQRASEQELIANLRHTDPLTRADIAELLGQRQVKAALKPLKEIVEKDPDGAVRQAAAIAVIRIGGDPLLAEVAKNLRHENPEVVAHAAVTLGKVGDAKVVPNLLAAFQTEDSLVGSAVAWALGRIGDSRAIQWLGAALENGFVPANAAEALGRIGDLEGAPILIRALQNPNGDARAYAARALGLIKEPQGLKGIRAQTWLQQKEEIIDALRLALEEDPIKKVRIFASIALFELGVKQAGKNFLQLLQDS
ncbi:MAG: HEAT repeat domain-containing protein [Myxococcales bacterium]|nr:HEAT repeat domain-containing protein [Myxococcales bacterium]MCB9642922.1 HEAT repeat domain-containing protein [Myxococcales bacterium]